MKTVIIHGQSHKGSSYHAGRLLADQLAAPDEITEFFLPRDLDHFCLGCCRCLTDERQCPFYEEKKVILDAMESAELMVFTTPTYCMRASAPMKSLIDLTFINWMPHRPRPSMFHKKAVIVSTAAGAGMGGAIKDIKTCLSYWGVPYIRTMGFAVQSAGWDGVSKPMKKRIEAKADALAKKVRSAKVHVGLKTHFLFNIMRLSNRRPATQATPMSEDYRYWQANGWFDGKRPY